jgi:hypothetical protein
MHQQAQSAQRQTTTSNADACQHAERRALRDWKPVNLKDAKLAAVKRRTGDQEHACGSDGIQT